MPTNRAFAYNPDHISIDGTYNIGDLAVGITRQNYNTQPGGLTWWGSPDEEQGYVIAVPVSGNTQPTPVTTDRVYLSQTYKATDIALSNNNQTATQVFSYSQSVLGENQILNNDRVMFSVQFDSTNPSVGVGGRVIGVGTTEMNYQGPFNGYPGNDVYSSGFSDDGKLYFGDGNINTGFPTWTSGDIIDIVLIVQGTSSIAWWIRVNGGYWNNNPSANPEFFTGGVQISVGESYIALCPYIYGSMTIQNYPKYGVPTGYMFLGNTLASVKFLGTKVYPNPFSDSTFIGLAETYFNQSFTSATEASTWLTNNGYWNSYPIPVLSLDAGDPLSYPGTGNVWTDLIGGKNFILQGAGPSFLPAYSSDNGGVFNFSPINQNYAVCSTSLPSLSNWTVGIWHYYDGTEIGGSPCIVTETYPGSTGQINYSVGYNTDTGYLNAGFYNNVGWNISGGYVLTQNNWYYIVGTYDGSSLTLYINGTLVITNPNVNTNSISSQGGIKLMKRWDNYDYWGGKLATVDIYSGALNQGEITSIWNKTKSRFGL
jgi:hypothetical protein